MLLLGHTGITVGVFKTFDILVRSQTATVEPSGPRSGVALTKAPSRRWLSTNKGLLAAADYRLVLLGSLLPDILDKPLWLFTASDIFPSGRAYGHTFLFNMVLLICGLILIRYNKSWLLVISLSSFVHLILDQMWDNPVTLWWPLLEPFHKAETTAWLSNIIHAVSSYPGTYIPEILGLIILLSLSYRLLVSKNMISFIRTGELG